MKQAYLEAQKKKKAEARKLKAKARAEAARPKEAVSVCVDFYVETVCSYSFILGFSQEEKNRTICLDYNNNTIKFDLDRQ